MTTQSIHVKLSIKHCPQICQWNPQYNFQSYVSIFFEFFLKGCFFSYILFHVICLGALSPIIFGVLRGRRSIFLNIETTNIMVKENDSWSINHHDCSTNSHVKLSYIRRSMFSYINRLDSIKNSRIFRTKIW